MSEKHILYLEDSRAEARLAREALRETGLPIQLTVVESGQEVLDYLQTRNGDGRPALDLLLVDLHGPALGGLEVLATIKQDSRFRRIPIIVLTASESQRELLEVYRLHANCVISKPKDWDEFSRTMSALVHFWLEVATLPKK